MDQLSTLCILIEILSGTQAQGEKSLNDFEFGPFIVRFPSDGPACSAERFNVIRNWADILGTVIQVLLNPPLQLRCARFGVGTCGLAWLCVV